MRNTGLVRSYGCYSPQTLPLVSSVSNGRDSFVALPLPNADAAPRFWHARLTPGWSFTSLSAKDQHKCQAEWRQPPIRACSFLGGLDCGPHLASTRTRQARGLTPGVTPQIQRGIRTCGFSSRHSYPSRHSGSCNTSSPLYSSHFSLNLQRLEPNGRCGAILQVREFPKSRRVQNPRRNKCGSIA